MTAISIVWPYWERFEAAFAGLRNMAALYPHTDLEIVIVDDGSPTQPAAALADFPAPWPVRVLTLPRKQIPKNPCLPINFGVKNAQGDVIVLTNPETTHREPILDALQAELARSGPKAYVLAGVFCPETQKWHCHSQHAPMGYHFCTMLGKELFLAAGGFDEAYREGAGYDDPDFVFRLKAAGTTFCFRDDLVAFHHKTGAHIDWPEDAFEKNRALFFTKWSYPRTKEAEAILLNVLKAQQPAARGITPRVAWALRKAKQALEIPAKLSRLRTPKKVAGQRTVLQIDGREPRALARRLDEGLNTLAPGSWRSLGVLRFGNDFKLWPGQNPKLLKKADVLHFHGLELWERARRDLPRKPALVTIHGTWDRLCLPFEEDVPTTVLTPDLLSTFPKARYLPDFLLDGEVKEPIPWRKGLLSVIHPLGEISGGIDDLAAFMALVPGLRTFVQPYHQVRPEPAVTFDKIRFFDACWEPWRGTYGPTSIQALAAGVVPLVQLVPGVAEEVARFFGENPFPHQDQPSLARALASYAQDRAKLREEQGRLRAFWEKKWRASFVIPKYLELYEALL